MSYYSQNVYGQPPSSNNGLQFLPTQFNSSAQSGSTSQGMMSGQGTGSYNGYGDGVREPLSTGILAAFGTQGYPDEPPLLEGELFFFLEKTKINIIKNLGLIFLILSRRYTNLSYNYFKYLF